MKLKSIFAIFALFVSASAMADLPDAGACTSYQNPDWDFMYGCGNYMASWANCMRAGAPSLKQQCMNQCGGATTGYCYDHCMTVKCKNQAMYCAEVRCNPIPGPTTLPEARSSEDRQDQAAAELQR